MKKRKKDREWFILSLACFNQLKADGTLLVFSQVGLEEEDFLYEKNEILFRKILKQKR